MADIYGRKNTFAIFDYGDKIVQQAIKELKYRRRSEVCNILIKEALAHIEEYIWENLQSQSSEKIIFVPIPEHESKVSWRGFNQSTLLAKTISSNIDGSSVDNILRKNIKTLPQARLKRNLRLKNVINTMSSNCRLDPKIPYIIIDDVTTTGATFEEATRVMRNAGAKKILHIALAHGYARK
jgi:ComF family protein